MELMPIRELKKQGKPYAYQWGWHGAIYKFTEHGKLGAHRKAEAQARAAYSSGWREK